MCAILAGPAQVLLTCMLFTMVLYFFCLSTCIYAGLAHVPRYIRPPLNISGYNCVFRRRAYPKTFPRICQIGIISDTTFPQNHNIRFHFFLLNLSCLGAQKLFHISRRRKAGIAYNGFCNFGAFLDIMGLNSAETLPERRIECNGPFSKGSSGRGDCIRGCCACLMNFYSIYQVPCRSCSFVCYLCDCHARFTPLYVI